MSKRIKRVLVIDDNPDIRETLRILFESEGFQVSVAADGAEALALQKEFVADVAVVDLFMPVKEGMETIVELRREFPQTKIIVISGRARKGGVDYFDVARELGVARCLTKPCEPRELMAAVHELTA